ncbi:hypothetical protein DFH07DRAFT_962926 [Mycena maculata]|uniref:Uncharacterized protein n=1 Tax=Mycena maculata TaxID=230809 RepID=A0AAD7IMA0_9AGAR|nr:hypothetical protein DFH07DRAFT_962926 [Mycena maculata]
MDLLSCEAVDIPNILQCRSTLLRTSLAYLENGRLKALSPIREYIRRVHPPSHKLGEGLRQHWDNMLVLWKSHKELPSGSLVSRLRSNLGNIDSLTQVTLARELSGADRQRLMHSILSLDLFSQNILKGKSPLAQYVVSRIEASGDRGLRWKHTCSCLDLGDYYSLPPTQADVLIAQGIQYFTLENDPAAEADFYKVAARYHYLTGNLPKALEFHRRGMTAIENQNIRDHLTAVNLKAETCPTGIGHSVSGKRITRNQAAAHWAMKKMCNTSDLCKIGRDILVTYGHEGSSREVNVLDIEAGLKFEKSEYDDARNVFKAVVHMTELNRHPYFHCNVLLNLVKIDLVMGRDESDILRGLDSAKKAATRIGWTQGMLFGERLMAGVHLARGEAATAQGMYILCFKSCQKAYMIPGATQCLEMLGDITYGMCGLEETWHWTVTYLAPESELMEISCQHTRPCDVWATFSWPKETQRRL